MKYLIIDCETTGLPPKKANWDINYTHFPYIVSLSWQIYDGKKLVSENNYIIRPDGYKIPNNTIKIHGITNEMAQKNGKDIIYVFNKLRKDLVKADKVIGFNIYFDTSTIKANIMRYKYDIRSFVDGLHKSKRIDLMYKTIKFVGKKKFPKLTELYFKLFGEGFDAHRSLNDVRATARCFFKLKEMGIV